MTNQFSNLTELSTATKKAALIQRLIKLQITDRSIIDLIVGYMFCDCNNNEYRLFEVEDLEIRIHTSVETFAKAITLTNHESAHSWAGGDSIVDTSWKITGDFEVGEDYFYQYSNNGNMESSTERKTDPSFFFDNLQISLIKRVEDDNFYNNSRYEEYYTLHILKPNGGCKISPLVQRIIEDFNL
jgi:hypothetical protein